MIDVTMAGRETDESWEHYVERMRRKQRLDRWAPIEANGDVVGGFEQGIWKVLFMRVDGAERVRVVVSGECDLPLFDDRVPAPVDLFVDSNKSDVGNDWDDIATIAKRLIDTFATGAHSPETSRSA